MSSFGVFESIDTQVSNYLSNFTGIANSLVTAVAAPITVGLTILIFWHGFNIIRGAAGHHHFLDVFSKILRAFFVVNLALVNGAYNTNVVTFLQSMRTSLTSLVSGTTSTNSYQALDQSMNQAIASLSGVMTYAADHISIMSGDFSGVIALVCAFFMVTCLVIYGLVACVNLMLVDLALAIFFGLGPLFVGALAFQSTQRFFDTWLGGALKYTMTGVVIAAVVGMANGILGTYTTNLANLPNGVPFDFVGASFGALGASGILILVALRVPQIAGDLVGGLGLSIVSPATAAAPMAAATAATGQAGANALAYGAGWAAGSAPVQALASRAGAAIRRGASGVSATPLGPPALAAAAAMRSMGGFALREAGALADGARAPGMGAAYQQGYSRVAVGIGTLTGAARTAGAMSRPLGTAINAVQRG